MADTSDWIEHDGGPCPVCGDAVVDLKFRDERISYNKTAMVYCGFKSVEDWWKQESKDPTQDIIAYRVVKP